MEKEQSDDLAQHMPEWESEADIPPSDPMPIGEALRRLCTAKRMPIASLARKLGVSRNTASDYVNGNRAPDRARLKSIMDALECTRAEKRFLLEAYVGFRIVPTSHNMPPMRTRCFTGREDLLERLDHQLTLQSPVALTQPVSVTGLGGIGKTEMALEYAYRHRSAYRHVLWATADSQEKLITEIRRLAASLRLPEKDENDPYRVVSAVRDWLNEHPNWLLILDNVEDLSLVTWVIPSEPPGAVLLTTRLQATDPVALALAVQPMPTKEGALLLLRRTKRLAPDAPLTAALSHDRRQAFKIAETVGGLPLALDQAAAYIEGTGCALAKYLALYEDHPAELLAQRARYPAHHPHPESVVRTFSLCFERVEQESPPAADLLRLCAFLAPDAIPETLITQGAAHLGPVLGPAVVDPYGFDEAMEVLRSWSLVHRDPNREELSLHRLLQMVLRDQMSEAVQQEWIRSCIRLLDQAFQPSVNLTVKRRLEVDSDGVVCMGEKPTVETEWCKRLVPHVLVMVAPSTARPTPMIEATPLFQKTADFLSDLEWFVGAAEPLYQHVIQMLERALGPDHLDLAAALEDLAWHYSCWRDMHDQAEPLLQRALQIREKAVGPDPPDVTAALEGLLHGWQGEQQEVAHYIHERVIQMRERAVGPGYPNMEDARKGLAWINDWREKHAYTEAVLLLSAITQEYERSHGIDTTAVALMELKELGMSAQAELPLQDETEQPDDSEVDRSCYERLEEFRGWQRLYAQAELLFQRVIQIHEVISGSRSRGSDRGTRIPPQLRELLSKRRPRTWATFKYEASLAPDELRRYVKASRPW